MIRDQFIGKGWSYYPEFADGAATLDMVKRERDIKESLTVLFTTLPGERIAHPLFGCDLQQYMFKPINSSLLSNIKQTVTNAITFFESRIKVLDVKTCLNLEHENRIDIEIIYQLNATNSRFNRVIPFNVLEGIVLE